LLIVFETGPHRIMMLDDSIIAREQAFHGSGNQ
jgi:hypothetical protein